MKFTANRSALLAELVHLQRIPGSPGGERYAGFFYLEARAGDVCLIANNRVTSLRTNCDADVAKPGATAAPAKKLLELVRALPEGAIDFETEGGETAHLRITAGDVLFRLFCIHDALDFPVSPDPPRDGVQIPPDPLRTLIARTSFAMARSIEKYTLAGAMLCLGGDQAVMVATDGHRLSYARHKVEGAAWQPLEVLIPAAVMGELEELLVDSTTYPLKAVLLSVTEMALAFAVGKRVVTSAPSRLAFPKYEAVIAQAGKSRAVIGRQALLDALKRTGLIGGNGAVEISFTNAGAYMVSADRAEGEVKETLALVEYSGPPVKVGFRGSYLTEFLGGVPSDCVSVDLTDGESQGLFTPVGGDAALDHRYVVMPMRL